jgi:OOP family OmpA-OmpF porin
LPISVKNKVMNRYTIVVLILLAVPTIMSAQFYDFKHGIVARKTLMDYNTFRGKSTTAFKEYRNGFELAYIRNFAQNLSLSIPVGAAVYQDSLVNCSKTPYTYVGAQGKYGIYNPTRWIMPYVLGGVNVLFPKEKDLAVEVPLGIGAAFKVHPQVYLNWQSDYRLSVSNWESHLQHSFGFIYMLGNKKMDKKTEAQMMKPDSDGDGIPDELDLCPSQAGLAKFSGCPDTDGDGIEDNKDSCPELKGLKELNGCPDSDGDGVSDNEDECPNVKGTLSNKGCPDSDIDGDGVPDKSDHCPDKAGLVNLFGCPDSDGDGISDKDDRCPNTPGTKAKGGCPDSKKDADNDGIDDEQDECPFTAGLIQYKGCPDTDGDGIQDKLDSCPNSPGPASNKGCPVIEKEDREVLDFAMRAVQFDLGKATLKNESFSILDKIGKVMRKYDAYNLAIGGHTDNTGSPAFNLNLSEKRAKICYEYLISRGIDASRLSYTGYGATKPISENRTENGRYLNRRTEFNLVPR